MNTPIDFSTTGGKPHELLSSVEAVFRSLLKRMDANILAATGLNHSSYAAICFIEKHPSTSIINLCSTNNLDHSSVARLVDRLIEKDLVAKSRRRCKDKRVVGLSLTDAGHEISAKIRLLRTQAQTKFLEPLTKTEAELLQTLISKLSVDLKD